MSESKHPSSGLGIWLIIACILLVIALGAWLVPLATCTNCEGKGRTEALAAGGLSNPPLPLAECPHCSGHGKVTLLKLWKLRSP
jgi:hypothetical protein